MLKKIAGLLMVLVLVITAFPFSAITANAAPARYFAETGHNLSGGFYTYWNNHGGLDLFGYPITEEVQLDGKTVQFFERAVFEYHPEFKGTAYETELRLLGHDVTVGREDTELFAPRPVEPSRDQNWYFPETGHWLNSGFLYYWQHRGGLDMFGYPISEEFSEVNPIDGQIYTVQYFERARFEYHPEFKGTAYETELGHLGVQTARALNISTAPSTGGGATQPATPPPFPRKSDGLGYGMNVQLFYADRDKVLNLVSEAGFGYVKQQVVWYDIEGQPGQYNWSELDNVINSVSQHGLKITLSITKAPSWATSDGGHGMPTDPQSLGNFMKAIAARYQGKVYAYEIWNEQNTGGETNGNVNAGRYVELLKAGFTGTKAGDPWAIVLFGGLTPTGVMDKSIAIDDVNFLEQVYQYNNGEVKNYFDVLGAHPGSNSNSPDQMWPNNPGNYGWSNHPSFYFRRAAQLHDVMAKYGDGDKQIWLTEFGWTTANQAPGYEYGKYITEALQAQYLVRAYQIAQTEWPWMGVMNVWNLNFSTIVAPSDEKAPWSIIRQDWSHRPAYDALKAMPK